MPEVDQQIAQSYLGGDKSAYNTVSSYIKAAFAPWKNRFGYETDDIISDIHYKLLISLNRGDFAYQASLKTYVSRIVCHTCIDYYRFNRKYSGAEIEELGLATDGPSPEELIEKQQVARINFRVIRLMSEECRQLWRLYIKKGLNCRQIGGLWNKTEGNIRRRLWACREKAKKIREKILSSDKRFESDSASKEKGK